MYKDFVQAVDRDDSLVEMGMYARQLEAYYELFPSENILVVLYDDIGADPVGLLDKLYSFVGVDNTFIPEMAKSRKGVTGAKLMVYRIPLINPVLFRVRESIRGTGFDEFLGRTGIMASVQRLMNKNRRVVDAKDGQSPEFEKLDKDTYERLVPLFKSDIKTLERMIGRDLSAWLDF